MAWRLRQAGAEAWGDEAGVEEVDPSPAIPYSVMGGASLATRCTQQPHRSTLEPATGARPPQFCTVPTLRALCLGFLGRHVETVVAELGPHLTSLPADVKACLLCVARRRGVLSNRVLLALADDGWTLLDLANAVALSERAVRQALLRCPRLRALDLTGLSSLSAALLRDLPAVCPFLEYLVAGGSKALEAALLEVLPDVLPHVRVQERPQEAVAESWEDVAAGNGIELPDPGVPCGLQRLVALVWPQAPALVRHIITSISPRVQLSDSLPSLPSLQQFVLQPMQPPQDVGSGARGGRDTRASSVSSEPAGAGQGRSKGAVPVYGDGGGGGDVAGGALRGPVNVLRVRKPVVDGGATSSEHRQWNFDAAAARWNAVGARYLAPHLRRQQQLRPRDRPEVQTPLAGSLEGDAGSSSPAAVTVEPALIPPPQQVPQQPHRDVPARLAAMSPYLPQAPHATATPWPRTGQQPDVGAPAELQREQQPQTGPTSAMPDSPHLDDCLACLVGSEAWEGMVGPDTRAQAAEELHIAEKFRMAYVEQDARLHAKAKREAAAMERYQLRTSSAARALSLWLDAE